MARITLSPADLWQHSVEHPRLTALVLGLLSATGFEPLGLWPLALAAMGAFSALIAESRDAKTAALLAWLFGVAHFTFSNNWIAEAFTHQAEMPAILGWAAVPLLSLYLAVFPAIAALGARAIAGLGGPPRLGWPLALAFAGCWTVSELLRSQVFTGYAWNPFAMVLLGPFDRPGLAALAAWTGTYALSGIAVLAAATLALLVRERRLVSAALVGVLLAAGMYIPAPPAREGTLRFTLVQPNLAQARINDPAYFAANFRTLADLSLPIEPGASRLVLWPESGLSDYLRPGYPPQYYLHRTAFGDPALARQRIGQTIGSGSMLLTGAVDLEFEGGAVTGVYNAVTAVDAAGEIRGGYAKAHLVPYGEYLPMRPLLEPIGLSRLVPGAIDFIPGPGPRTLDLGTHGKAGIQICYEIVFSGQVVDRGARPDYIFNPSNDGWFGAFGPPQHLAQARMRAIEEGLPVLRATTTGISAAIDSRGVVRQHLPLHQAGRLDGTVPPALTPTPFARLGNLLAIGWAILFLALAAVALRQRPG